jgi:hypothetical protein
METNSKVVSGKAKSFSREVRNSQYDVTRLSLNPTDVMQRILSEELFLGMLCLDRKRAERSGKKLVLLLLDAESAEKSGRKA